MNPSLLKRVIRVLFLVLAATPSVSAEAQTPAPCRSRPEHRQFDFWVGEWDVLNPRGQLAGTNSVQLILGDCVLLENWKGAGGVEGKSFNVYNTGTGKWQQTWVDSGGNVLELAGEYRDDQMRFAGETPSRGGAKTLHRLTFNRISADRVRQFWEQSSDNGKTWAVAFDGTYVRRK